VALSAASAAPAAASGTPGWRIVQVLPGVTSGDELPGLTVGGLAAPGPRDAWLVGTNGATAIVRHWDGKAWRGLTPPKDLINSPFDQGIETMTASSASNLWIFDARGPDSSVINSEALHRSRPDGLRNVARASPVRSDPGNDCDPVRVL